MFMLGRPAGHEQSHGKIPNEKRRGDGNAQSMTIAAASLMSTSIAATLSSMTPLFAKPMLKISRPRARLMTASYAVPARDATPPC